MCDVRETVRAHSSKNYVTEHYRTHGFLEGWLPHDPIVDEDWYRKTYPYIDEAIRLGREIDGRSHFIKPVPASPRAAERAPLGAQKTPTPTTRPSTRVRLRPRDGTPMVDKSTEA